MKKTLRLTLLVVVVLLLGACSKEEQDGLKVVQVELDRLPAKVDYYVGEQFDVSGLALKITYSNKATKVVSVKKEQVTGFNSSAPNADQVLQVEESGFVVRFSIKILADNIPLIVIKSPPIKTVYTMGESLSLEGMVLGLTYRNGTTTEINSVSPDWVKGFDSAKPSLKQSLQIDIEGNKVALDVTVLPIKVVDNEIVSSASSDVKSLSIPEGITAVQKDAFFNNPTIEEVVFPASMVRIGADAFNHCVNLKRADLSKTSISVLSSGVFDRAGLETISLPPTLKIIEAMALSSTIRLKELILPEGVEQIGLTAFSRSGLETITLPNTVCYIARAFYECEQLKTVRTAGSKVTTNFDKVPTIESECFNFCPNLEVLEIPESITQIGVGVLGVCKVTTLILPASVNTLEHHAFGNAPSLEQITLKSATKVDAANQSVPSTIKTIKVPRQLVDAYKQDSYWSEFATKIIAL